MHQEKMHMRDAHIPFCILQFPGAGGMKSSPSLQVILRARPGIVLHSLCNHKRRGRQSFSSAFVRCRWARITKSDGIYAVPFLHFVIGRGAEVFSEIASVNVTLVCPQNRKEHHLIMWAFGFAEVKTGTFSKLFPNTMHGNFIGVRDYGVGR